MAGLRVSVVEPRLKLPDEVHGLLTKVSNSSNCRLTNHAATIITPAVYITVKSYKISDLSESSMSALTCW